MRNEGSMIISLIFIMIVAFLALGLLHFSLLHTRIRGARADKFNETSKMSREMTYYLHNTREKTFNERVDQYLEPENDFFNKDSFPNTTTNDGNGIQFENTFSHYTMPGEFYQETRISDIIDETSNQHNYHMRAEVYILLLSGKIPLTLFPFFIDAEIKIPLSTFMEENDVTNEGNIPIPNAAVETQLDTTTFLAHCLEIGGTALTWRGMREKFGLEASDEPIVSGIHRVIDGELLSCIFIQGDVNELSFSFNGPYQEIKIIKDNICYQYRYLPGQYYFYDGIYGVEEALHFKERIVVNGNILNLRQDGEAAFTPKTNLILYASGRVVIQSSLETDRLNLTKIKSTNLTLISTYESLFQLDGTPGVSVKTGDSTVLNVSILTDGTFQNSNSQTKIQGSLHCGEFINEGKVSVTWVMPNATVGDFFHTMDYKCIREFRILAVEDIADENK